MKSKTPADPFLKLPRTLRDERLQSMRPEVVALYNRYCELLRTSPWPQFRPPLLRQSYPRWSMFTDWCQAEKLDGGVYLAWILAGGVLSHPFNILPFAMAGGTLYRYRRAQQGGVAPTARFGAFGARLVDDRTGEVVRWIFDRQGQPLVTPPASGEVYDADGHPIFLRRSA